MLVIHHRAQDVSEIRADYAEIDVMMTADRVVVCRHDHIYEGETVWSQKYAPGMGTPLREFFENCPASLLVELKLGSLHMAAGLMDFETEVLRQSSGAFAYLSFDFGSLYRLRQINSSITLVVNTHDNRLPGTTEQVKRIVDAVCVHKSEMQHHLDAGILPVFVYGADVPSDVPDSAVGVITDHPELWNDICLL